MNKNKISPNLLSDVSILNKENKKSIIVSSDNFNETKKFLTENKFNFKSYRFINCFCIDADNDDINILSHQSSISYLYSNSSVLMSNSTQDFVLIDNLTNNEYLGENETICFIDTGIHPHLDFLLPKCRIVKFIDLINGHSLPYDDNGHGTHVVGVACGGGIFNPIHKGFAPRANIIVIKALTKDGNSNSNVILDAMEWVYQNHKAYNIGIVCMSFGADSETNIDPLSRGAEVLWQRGLVVVAAAGNSGPDKQTIKSPGNNPHIITVGAIDTDNMSVAEFSSRGPTLYGHKPDLLAPAVNIISCNNKSSPYTKMSGTSVATPIIAGICADIKSRYPKMSNIEIKKYLLSKCEKLTGDIDNEGAGYIRFN